MNYMCLDFVDWQKKCVADINTKQYVVLASPTGSGKTRCYEIWAFNKMEKPIFITSPTKALSNQRFRELMARGYKVGLETGDVHYFLDEDVDIICCTQEVYNFKYRHLRNCTLIVDEFSYIFDDNKRARIYIDSLRYSEATNILVCSATFGNPEAIRDYLNMLTGKDFFLYENTERLTSLEYRGEIDIRDIKNSLVVSFSTVDCYSVALKIYRNRCNITDSEIGEYHDEIEMLAKRYNIRNKKLIELANKGVVYYYGKLYPKEKLFIEELFEKRLIDTVVGTDALALGVNFPIENVIFVSLTKKGSLISKNLFTQLCGRAGRKSYFDKGYVYWCDAIDGYNKERLKREYEALMVASMESFEIDLRANIKDILMGNVTVQEEAFFIALYSTVPKSCANVEAKIQNIIDFITTLDVTSFMLKKVYSIDISDGFYRAIQDFDDKRKNKLISIFQSLLNVQPLFEKNIHAVYFDEYSYLENCLLFIDVLLGTSLYTLIKRYCCITNRNGDIDMLKLLRLRKYLQSLPLEYSRIYDLNALDTFINQLDFMVLQPYSEPLFISDSDYKTDLDVLKANKSNLKAIMPVSEGAFSVVTSPKRVEVKKKRKKKNRRRCKQNLTS